MKRGLNQLVKVMFDTNAFDKLLSYIPKLSRLVGRVEYYITDIQICELAKIPDDRKEIRLNNIRSLCALRPYLVSVPFTFDCINFSKFSFKTETSYEMILNETHSNRNDALIAAAAIHEGCILVTDDTRLIKRVLQSGNQAITFDIFIGKYLETDFQE